MLDLRHHSGYSITMPQETKGAFHYPPVSDRTVSSDIYLTSIGRMEHFPSTDYPAKGHPGEYEFDWNSGRALNDFALVWISKGEGEKELSKGAREPFANHETIFLIPGKWHRYRPLPKSGWREQWICLNGEHLHRLRSRGLLPSENQSLGFHPNPAWLASFDSLHKAASQAPRQNDILWGAQALHIVLQAYALSSQSSKSTHSSSLIESALLAIRENAHRPFTVADLATLHRTTQRTLERHFAQHHVRSPQQEIIHVRLERATRMLANPEIPIKEIAYTCGFGSPKLMSYNFRRFRRQTPSQLRKQGQGQDRSSPFEPNRNHK